MAMAVDIYALGAEALSDVIDGNLGAGSPFYDGQAAEGPGSAWT